MRVSTDKWARVSWLLCCVQPLAGIFGIDPKVFSFHHKTFPKGSEAQFCPQGWWVATYSCVHPLSLGSLGLTLPKIWEAQFCRPELVGCYVVAKLWYPNIWKHKGYKSKYARVLVAMMCPSSISLVSQFPFTDNCRGHSLFVIDYNPPPPPSSPLVIDFVQYWLFARQSYSSGISFHSDSKV